MMTWSCKMRQSLGILLSLALILQFAVSPFAANAADPAVPITEIVITGVTPPTGGGVVHYNWGVPEGVNYVVYADEDSWYGDGVTEFYMEPGMTFAEGKSYTLWVYFKAEAGYTLGANSQIKATLAGVDHSIGTAVEIIGSRAERVAVFDFVTKPVPVSYSVSVDGGTNSHSTATSGTTVTINASIPPEGKKFDSWTDNSGGVTLADASSASTTFTMPDADVSVTANYVDDIVIIDEVVFLGIKAPVTGESPSFSWSAPAGAGYSVLNTA